MIPVDEDRILLPRDPAISDSNDWLTFSLRKVNVVSEEGDRPVSLLAANSAFPVKVSGVLQRIDSNLNHLVKDRKYHTKRIRLNNVTTYAFAEYNDGSYGFWAAGQAGWFEVDEPIPQYRHIYNQMTEAASMFYSLADCQRKSRRKNVSMSTEELNQYVEKAFKEVGKSHVDQYAAIEGRLFAGESSKDAKKRSKRQKRTKQGSASQPSISGKSSESNVTRKSRRKVGGGGPQTPARPSPQLEMEYTSGDEEYDEDGNPIEHHQGPHKRKSTSILQPKGSKFSKKAANRRRSPNATDVDNAQVSESNSFEEDQLPREVSPLAAVSRRDVPQPTLLAQRYEEIKVIPHEIPTDQPQGPGDLWTCPFENCEQRVHQGSEPKGQAKIKEHFQLHAQQAQEKIDLALKESRPYLPVRWVTFRPTKRLAEMLTYI
ncbi:MAG: hypothetical protein LQ342_002974 [Letrouitia transgressa]|nr:MAG: hypothetical protein LQ342_002974 [Letrouitia transgressa]